MSCNDTAAIEPGHVGMHLAEGQVVLTTTGRRTSAFPKLDFSTARRDANTCRRVEHWLLDNGVAEAEGRADKFNIHIFKGLNPSNLSVADKDSLECYLFDPSWRHLH